MPRTTQEGYRSPHARAAPYPGSRTHPAQGQVDPAVRPYFVLKLVLLLVEEGLSRQVLEESLLPRFEVSSVGYPHQSPAVPNKLSIVLNKVAGQRPLGEGKEDDPKKVRFHNVPHGILHTNRHLILRSFGHDVLKVKQPITTAW